MNYDYDIILPFYKDYVFLKRCFKNINCQTIKAKNLIFIDDGNKDENLKSTVSYLLDDSINLIYIKNKENIKVEASLQKGFAELKSKYFYLLATDDIYENNFASETLKILNEHPSSPFCFSKSIINNEINNMTYILKFKFLNKEFYKNSEVKNIFQKNQFKIYVNTVIFRTDFFKKHHIMKPIFLHRADMINLLYLSYLNGFCYCDKKLSKFTVREGQYGSRILPDNRLLEELNNLRKFDRKFYLYFLKICNHFDLSVFSTFKLIKDKHYHAISFKWIIRSIKFRIWKKIRFKMRPNQLNFLYNLFK